jgi:hypothetical protein
MELKYFVLKPRGKDVYAKSARLAMRVFAEGIKSVNSKLANELMEWCDEEQRRVGE